MSFYLNNFSLINHTLNKYILVYNTILLTFVKNVKMTLNIKQMEYLFSSDFCFLLYHIFSHLLYFI